MSEIKILKVSLLRPHPDNPRKDLGDLTELTSSIKQDGILQNFTVLPLDEEGFHTVIIGHRRLEASKRAGLEEVPCTITEMDEKRQASTMLAENMQRSDLTPYEQAQGFQYCLDLGMTANEVSKETGLSKTTVKHRIALLKLDQDKVKDKTADGATIFDFMKLEKIKDPKKRNEALESIGTNNFEYAVNSAIREENQAKNFAKLKRTLKSFATEIEDNDCKKHKQVKHWAHWSDIDDFDYAKPEDADEKNYMFTWKKDSVVLYAEYTKEELKENKKPSELEIKREQRAEIQEKLNGLTHLFFELRKSFVNGIIRTKLSQEQEKTVLKYSAIVMADRLKADCDSYDNDYDVDDELVEEFIKKEEFVYEDVLNFVTKDSTRALLVFTYARLDNGNAGRKLYDWEGYFESDEEQPVIELCYEMLEELGYQKSDTEIAFFDGTHEYYMVEEVEENIEDEDTVTSVA